MHIRTVTAITPVTDSTAKAARAASDGAALDVVADVMETHDVRWVSGRDAYFHGNHLSADIDEYRTELRRHCETPRWRTRVRAQPHRILWGAADRLKEFASPCSMRAYEPEGGERR